ncbi:hypothetical protein CCP2SC5_360021 [Azospirillaceae bacterium]
MFLVVGDHKGGAKAPLIREAIFHWNCLFVRIIKDADIQHHQQRQAMKTNDFRRSSLRE